MPDFLQRVKTLISSEFDESRVLTEVYSQRESLSYLGAKVLDEEELINEVESKANPVPNYSNLIKLGFKEEEAKKFVNTYDWYLKTCKYIEENRKEKVFWNNVIKLKEMCSLAGGFPIDQPIVAIVTIGFLGELLHNMEAEYQMSSMVRVLGRQNRIMDLFYKSDTKVQLL